jgi:hypothetical protein
MSDDLPPLVGHVHPHHARILAAGRTLVNLDALDFSPVLAALKPLSTTARQLAEWEAAGWIGEAGGELLLRLGEQWAGLESALGAAGLTENAAWLVENEQKNLAARMLRDLARDLRNGEYGPDGKFDHEVLAKRLGLAVEMVQALTPTPAPHTAILPPRASARDLAELVGKPLTAVESFLRRHRDKAPDCFVTVDPDDRRRNEPKYLYRVADVLPVLKEHFAGENQI